MTGFSFSFLHKLFIASSSFFRLSRFERCLVLFFEYRASLRRRSSFARSSFARAETLSHFAIMDVVSGCRPVSSLPPGSQRSADMAKMSMAAADAPVSNNKRRVRLAASFPAADPAASRTDASIEAGADFGLKDLSNWATFSSLSISYIPHEPGPQFFTSVPVS